MPVASSKLFTDGTLTDMIEGVVSGLDSMLKVAGVIRADKGKHLSRLSAPH